MNEVVSAAVLTQESAVTELPRMMQGGKNPDGIEVPPLPVGPKERGFVKADGQEETATAAQLGLPEGEADQQLYFYDPTTKANDAWRAAKRVLLPLRSTAGEVVNESVWKAQHEVENEGMWSR